MQKEKRKRKRRKNEREEVVKIKLASLETALPNMGVCRAFV